MAEAGWPDDDDETCISSAGMRLLDVDAAHMDYGVIMDGDSVDPEATRIHRAQNRLQATDFDFGPERAAWEQIFDDETATDFALRLQQLPATGRQSARQAIIAEVLPKLKELDTYGLAGVVDDPIAQKVHLKRLIDERLPALDARLE